MRLLSLPLFKSNLTLRTADLRDRSFLKGSGESASCWLTLAGG